jgi:DNA-binding SARP family transcriptional activator
VKATGRIVTNGVTFDVLGALRVRIGRRPVAIPSGRLSTLLAALLLAEGEPVPVGVLAGRLWPERPPIRANATVHTYVARLRKLLGPELIRTTAGQYQLLVEPECVDLFRFRDLVRRAVEAAPSDQEVVLLRQALELWRGQPFGDGVSSWLDHDVTPKLMEEWFAATERRIDLDLAAGGSAGVIADLRELTGQFPTRESLWVRLISALRSSGRRAEALEAYRSVRETLNDELGIEPGEELNDLQRAVLRDGMSGPRDDPVGAVQQRESAPALPHVPTDDEPATVTVSAGFPTPAQLPADITEFVGREAEVAALDDVLRVGRASAGPTAGSSRSSRSSRSRRNWKSSLAGRSRFSTTASARRSRRRSRPGS